MELENLAHVIIELLTDFGNLKAFITTENETKLYNSCELKVLRTVNGNRILKIEGKNSKENKLNG